ncbi:hypothetical protein VP01_1597g2 [Puccinia sorghi]|uniref:Uncharacterized protein n=1 Tax=Puccinia sorghi TaxID=27349 RepID=A0A0L6VJ90_9BASI|nr:hypothetical protein VP01_1597g2 [Puccinia sorghi]
MPRLRIGIPQRNRGIQIRLYNEGLLQQQKQQQLMDLMALLFPTYLHMKKLTKNWTLDTWDSNYSSKVCQCPVTSSKLHSVDHCRNTCSNSCS